MIAKWSDVMSRYNELSHTSRASNHLNEWGVIFASAYKLDRHQANAMWQEIIDMNITKDLAYAKYFVAQIFNKILDNLSIHEAVEFLYMNPTRVPMLYMNPYSRLEYFDYCILGHYIIRNDNTSVVEFLRILNKNNVDDEFQNVMCICDRFFSVTRSLGTYNTDGRCFYYFETSQEVVQKVYEWCERTFPNSYMSQMARVHYLLLMNKVESDPVDAVKLLLLCENLNNSMFTDFLYMHRNIIPKNKIDEMLLNYCQIHKSLPLDISVDNTGVTIEKARWYQRYFFENEAISKSILLRTSGRLRDGEKAYFANLAKTGAWEVWVSLLSRMITIGDASFSRSCISYVSDCVRIAITPKYSHDIFFPFEVSRGNQDIEYYKLSDSQKIEFAKATAMLCSCIKLSSDSEGLCENVLEFIQETPAVHDAMLHINSVRALLNYGQRLVTANAALLDAIQTASDAKEEENQAERARQEAELQHRTTYLYESLSHSSSGMSAFVKLPDYVETRQEAELQHRVTHLYESLLHSSSYKSAFIKLPDVADHFEMIMNLVLSELALYLKGKQIDLGPFICKTPGVCVVHLTDEDGNIERNTSMIVPRSDNVFSEYLLRYTEAVFREKVNYSRVNYPDVPVSNSKAKYYSFPNGSRGYYRCVNKEDQLSLVEHDSGIYIETQKIAETVVNRYFEEHPTILISLKAAYENKPKKTLIEELESIINATANPDQTLTALFKTYKQTTPTNQKTKATAASALVWDYWVLHAASSKIRYEDFTECFANAKWEYAQKKALALGNYAAAFDYFLKFHSVFSKRLRNGDDLRIKKCVILSMYATAELCNALQIDTKTLFLGEWKQKSWLPFSNSTTVNIAVPQILTNIGDIIVYDTRNKAVCESYEHTDAQTTIIRYILKLVESTFYYLAGLQPKNTATEKIDGLFHFDNYQKFVELLPNTIISATNYAYTCFAELIVTDVLPEIEVGSNKKRIGVTQASSLGTDCSIQSILRRAVMTCYAIELPQDVPTKEPYEYFEINLDLQTYRDFLSDKVSSDVPVVQEQNKLNLTRFYQLYDSYCDQMQQIFEIPIKYDPTFSYATSKLRITGGGFVGKDLYQLNQIINDSRDFIQWIARVEKGEVIYPDFQPYVPLLYYFIINDRLFAERRDIGLVVMCKVWNHFFDDMPAQDVSLILGWIKDYWMIHCQDISLSDFKRLFDRKVVFLNEPTVDILNCDTVLEYYNEICFYRVLHGKLVTKGHRNLFEDVFEVVNRRIAAVWAEYGLSYESMLYQAAGKSTYVFLRAIVTRDIQYPIASRSLKRRVSSDEEYVLNENEKTLRLQWEFVTQEYDVAFIKAFMEYTLKLTEYRLRMWLGYSASDSFNVDASSIYKFEQKDATVKKILLDNQNIGRIEKIIYETVAEICESKGVVQRGYYEPFAVFHGSEDYTSEALLAEEEKLDYEGIDPNQRITGKSLEEARQVLLRNQGKLVIDYEEDKPDVTPEPVEVSFDPMELKLLRILIYSDNVAFELQNMLFQNIVPSVLITKINEKAMDLIGDVLVDEEQSPPSVYEDYIKIIQEVLEANE